MHQRTSESLPYDDTVCIITRQGIRHPVKLSNDKHYELKAYVDYLKETQDKRDLHDPHNPKPITSGQYNNILKEKLDHYFNEAKEDRFDEYKPGEKEQLLKELNSILNPSLCQKASKLVNPVAKVAGTGLFFGALAIGICQSICNFFPEQTDTCDVSANTFLGIGSTLMAAAADGALRYLTQDVYGLADTPRLIPHFFQLRAMQRVEMELEEAEQEGMEPLDYSNIINASF